MKIRLLFAALVLLVRPANAQPGIVLDSVGPVQTGQTVCVSVLSKGFMEVVSMQSAIIWDPQVLDFYSFQNLSLPGLSAASFNLSSQHDQLLFSWSENNGFCLSRDDDEVLFEMCFIITGPAGSSSNLGIDTALILNCPNGENIWTSTESPPIKVEVTTSAGDINDVFEHVLLSPNPTDGNAQLLVRTPNPEIARFWVTDALGKTVFEQEVTLNTGENRLQIPAASLKMPGIYLVGLRTVQGTVSRLLLVNGY